MITLEENIHLCVLLYPSLFMDPYMDPSLWPQSRKAVLNQLFLVIGNGYHWVNGGLLGYGEPDKQTKRILNALNRNNQATLLRVRKEVAKACHDRWPDHYPLNKDGLHDFNEGHRRHLERVNAHMRWANENKPEYQFEEFYSYPLSSPKGFRCGILAEIPDDIKPDYLAGVLEALECVINSPASEEQKGYATEWIEEIKERFKL